MGIRVSENGSVCVPIFFFISVDRRQSIVGLDMELGDSGIFFFCLLMLCVFDSTPGPKAQCPHHPFVVCVCWGGGGGSQAISVV